ncbi:terminase large subunit domain-containing protein [Bifidobacterium vansinderenii]|uniref:Terminase n=1 Tax=Bifidobacterium vansinderenii TaxID=1984871 RepID=A0A229W1B0_9BIFI|nr:terminase family protein [Bifidobacterium vansinderenii]OXN01647.1 terminase [Bifidobacterium vansinderenii]
MCRRSESRTSRSTPIPGASELVIPDDMATTSEPSLNAFVEALGFALDPWQRAINRLALAKRADGLWAARNVDMSIPRQTGKTFTAGFIPFHRCIRNPRFTAIWTTHHFSVTQDTFQTLRDIALMDEMNPFIDPDHGIHSAAGKEAIYFRNGSRIAFKARENGAIRGFKKVGLLVLDEAQHLTDSALASVLPTQNRADNPQTWYMGTPPGPDQQGDVFARHRANALAGRSARTLYVEFSAERGTDPLDRNQWMRANPSYPQHTSDESILNLYEELAPDDFRRECLGIWDDVTFHSAIDPDAWAAGIVERRAATPNGWTAIGVDMPPDRSSLAIGACRAWPDGMAHVELAMFRDTRQHGTAWAVDWITQRWPRMAAVVIDAQSPATVLVPDLKRRGVQVTLTGPTDMGQAVGRFQDMLRDRRLAHLTQAPLDMAVGGCTLRHIGQSGAMGWNKLGSDVDISPLVAVTLALHGAMTSRRRPGQTQRMIRLA